MRALLLLLAACATTVPQQPTPGVPVHYWSAQRTFGHDCTPPWITPPAACRKRAWQGANGCYQVCVVGGQR